MEYASTENTSTDVQRWKTQVSKMQVRICRGGKCKYEYIFVSRDDNTISNGY